MDLERCMEQAKLKYGVERHHAEARIHENNKKRELAFLAMLDWFFSQDKAPKGFLKKDKLKILDVGCGRMMYAFPLKLFFEHAGRDREVSILGIDPEGDDLKRTSKDLARRKLENIKLQETPIEALPEGRYNVITCFNCLPNFDVTAFLKHQPTGDSSSFFKQIANHMDKDSVLLVSFFNGSQELDWHKTIIKNAGLKICFGANNPFSYEIAPIGSNSNFLFVARK